MSASDSRSQSTPAIVAPVMRQLAVADVSRSIAFYRDLLGFEVRRSDDENGAPAFIELVNGPARIQLRTRDVERSAAVLFFQTEDVAAMHALIRARGGNRPSRETSTGSKCGCARFAIRTGTRSGSANRSILRTPRRPLRTSRAIRSS